MKQRKIHDMNILHTCILHQYVSMYQSESLVAAVAAKPVQCRVISHQYLPRPVPAREHCDAKSIEWVAGLQFTYIQVVSDI